MRIGIVGWPGSGKTTLFKALGGISPPGHRGGTRSDSWPLTSVDVPDSRLVWLRELCKPRKYTPARIEFVDFPGIPKGAEKGRGELMHAIRDVDALCVVTRDFPSLGRPAPDPSGDMESLLAELIFCDFIAVETRIDRLKVQVKKPTRTQERDRRELALLERILPSLEEGRPINQIEMKEAERALICGFSFASEKTILKLVNVPEERAAQPSPPGYLACCATIEAEIADLSLEERREFLDDYGISEPFRERLIRLGYETLGLLSFFTIGPDEVRAWTIDKGDDAITAAGKIHSDLARGFIRAEVYPFEDLKSAGGLKETKAEGNMRLEGKDYVVQDGEIVHIRFGV